MVIFCLYVTQTAPFASYRAVWVFSIELNVLYGVTKGPFVDTGAPRDVSFNLDNWKGVDQFLCISAMSHCGHLKYC